MTDHLDLKDKGKVLLEHGVRIPHTKNVFFSLMFVIALRLSIV